MIRGVVKYRKHPEVLKRELKATVKDEFPRVGRYWYERMMPGHFEPAAEGKYHYSRRSAKYLRDKQRRFGHQRPLEYTGDMKRQAGRTAKITATGKAVRVVMTGPRSLYMYRKDYKQPNKAAELTAVTKDEVLVLAKMLDRLLTKRLNDGSTN